MIAVGARLRWLVVLVAAALVLTGCGSEHGDEADADAPASNEPAGNEPVRVAALSGDVAEVLVELVGPERLVAVPESTTTSGAGNNPELMARVPNAIESVSNVDPEQILSYDPDLVVVTSRHEAEQDAGQLLTDSGVPLVVIENNWETFDQIADNVTTLGDAVGEPERADDLVTTMREQVAETTDAVSGVADPPSVLVLLSLGANNPYLLGPGSIASHLVRAAGAELAATELGLDSSVQADPEQVVKADPDAIVLIDSRGRGIDDYAELLAIEAVTELDAVRGDRVLVLDSTVATATAGVHTAEGLDIVACWLHPERFDSAENAAGN